MSFVAWIPFGLVTGFIGSRLVNSTGRQLFLDAALAVGGGVMGGFVFQWLSEARGSELNLWSLFTSVCGAAFVLFVFHAASGQPPAKALGVTYGSGRRRFSSQSPSRRHALGR